MSVAILVLVRVVLLPVFVHVSLMRAARGHGLVEPDLGDGHGWSWIHPMAGVGARDRPAPFDTSRATLIRAHLIFIFCSTCRNSQFAMRSAPRPYLSSVHGNLMTSMTGNILRRCEGRQNEPTSKQTG